MQSKVELRKKIKHMRSTLHDDVYQLGNRIICDSLCSLPLYKEAQSVMAYLAIGKEVCIDDFILQAYRDGKVVYVPYCTEQPGIMKAVRLTSLDDVCVGAFSIRAPKNVSVTALAKDIDFIVVPGVAFDAMGNRLGMGAGYYDRFLHGVDEQKCVAVCWEFQVSEDLIPTEPHDVHMGIVVTEERIILSCKEA